MLAFKLLHTVHTVQEFLFMKIKVSRRKCLFNFSYYGRSPPRQETVFWIFYFEMTFFNLRKSWAYFRFLKMICIFEIESQKVGRWSTKKNYVLIFLNDRLLLAKSVFNRAAAAAVAVLLIVLA